MFTPTLLISSIMCVYVRVPIQVQTSTGETFARNTEALFMETSAKDGRNVQELFRTIGTYVKEVLSIILIKSIGAQTMVFM